MMASINRSLRRLFLALQTTGASKPNEKNSLASASQLSPSHLLATRITGLSSPRSRLATRWSSPIGPALASTTNNRISAPWMPISICCSISSSSSSTSLIPIPPVSMSSKYRLSFSMMCFIRSRVTPAMLSTIAKRRPTNQLKILDFPTLGRPTIDT